MRRIVMEVGSKTTKLAYPHPYRPKTLTMSVVLVGVLFVFGGCTYRQSAGERFSASNQVISSCQASDPQQPVEYRRDVEMLAIKVAYDNDRRRFDCAHSNVYGWVGRSMDHWHWEDHRRKYESIVIPWLLETSASEKERRFMEEYAPSIEEALVPRARLLEKIEIWNRIKDGRGDFSGRTVMFVNGIAAYNDMSYVRDEFRDGFPMKLRIDRNLVWTTQGTDYALAHSDCAYAIDEEIKGKDYDTDQDRNTWFLRFKDGVLIDVCELGNAYWDGDDLLFYFWPENNRLEIMSMKTGDCIKELFLSLWDYEGDGENFHHFGTKVVPVSDKTHDCSKISELSR